MILLVIGLVKFIDVMKDGGVIKGLINPGTYVQTEDSKGGLTSFNPNPNFEKLDDFMKAPGNNIYKQNMQKRYSDYTPKDNYNSNKETINRHTKCEVKDMY
jgi:hypothetical protein